LRRDVEAGREFPGRFRRLFRHECGVRILAGERRRGLARSLLRWELGLEGFEVRGRDVAHGCVDVLFVRRLRRAEARALRQINTSTRVDADIERIDRTQSPFPLNGASSIPNMKEIVVSSCLSMRAMVLEQVGRY